jgi:3-hydroxyisobutyrate dehydrogenase
MSDLSIGVIGVGAFGSKVALRLLRNGHPALNLYDVNDICTRLFTNEFGGMALGSPKMMAQCCDVVVTVLPSARELREACFGWESLTKGFENGGVVVNLGMLEPMEAAAIARELGERGVDFLDAPAYGTRDEARAGTLTLLVGGDEAVFTRLRPLLETMASRVERVGDAGAPQALGAIADYLRGAQMLAASEAMRIGERFGLPPAIVARIAEQPGIADLAAVLREHVIARKFETGRPLGMVRTNIDAAARLASTLGLPSPLLGAAREAWRNAEAVIGSGADYTAIVRWLESVAATQAEAASRPEPPAA